MLTRSQSAWKRAIDRDIEVVGRIVWVVEHDMEYDKDVSLRINTLDGKRKVQKLSVQVPSRVPRVLTVGINCEKQRLNTEYTAVTKDLAQSTRKYNLDRDDEYDFTGSIDIDNSSIKMVVRERRLLLIELFFIVSEILELPRSIIHVTVSILDRFVHIRSYNYIDNKSSVPYYLFVFLCCFMLAYKMETNKNYETTKAIRLWLLLLFNEQGHCNMELVDLNKLEAAILVAIDWKLMSPNTNTFMHTLLTWLSAIPGHREILQLTELINESILADNENFERFPSSLLAISSITLATLLIQHTHLEWDCLDSGYTTESIQDCVLVIQDLFRIMNTRSCEAVIQLGSVVGSPTSAVFNSKDAQVTPEIEEKVLLDLSVSPVKLPSLHQQASIKCGDLRIYQFKSRDTTLHALNEKYLLCQAYCVEDAVMLLDKICQL